MAGPDPEAEDLEDLYENAPCGYLSLGKDGTIVKVNRTFATWLDRDPAELLGLRLHSLLNVAGKIFYETHFAPLLRMQGFFNEVALDFVRGDGTIIQVLANAAERRDDAGKLLFTRLTIFLATERRRYERELVAAKDRAQAERRQAEARLFEEHETAELREQFIAVLGHDLRNPLSAIDGGTSILLRQPQSDRSLQVIGLMKTSLLRMRGLIDNILDFARGRLGGGLVLSRDADRSLAQTIEQVVNEMRAAFPDRLIETNLEVGSISVDHARIAQMCSNLLGNAVTHGSATMPILVAARVRNDVLEISIANEGPPIAPETIDRLFLPFTRGDASASIQGLGLGLYISSMIAQAHGGRIDVTSDDRETCFTFRMPLG